MIAWREFRAALAIVLAASLACAPGRALVTLNDGHDKIFVNAGVSVSRDSNVYANSDDRGDYVYSTNVSADYSRRAGWIGVNASASVASSRFGELKEQDFDNPSFSLEFTKQSGRTTGALNLGASRESRADAAVNLRSTSWHVPVTLNFKYPIIGTYTLAGSMGYSSRRYVDETVFASLATYHASFDLLHMLTTERDAIAAYRYRFSDTSRDSTSIDHSFSLGMTGRLIRGVNGNIRVGYQSRTTDGVRSASGVRAGRVTFGSWTASGSATYTFSKRTTFSGTIAKDFSTTATDASVDTTTLSLDAHYIYSSRFSATGGVSFGDTDFLGETGRIVLALGTPPVLGPQRHDNYLSWNGAINYTLNEHFKASLSYAWFKNWSTYSYADFVRSAWTVSMSTRW